MSRKDRREAAARDEGPDDVVDAEVVDAEIVDDDAAEANEDDPDGDATAALEEIVDAEVVVTGEDDKEPSGLTAAGDLVVDDEADGAAADDAGAVDDGEPAVIDVFTMLEKERDDYLDALRRLQAEFENYKKRMLKLQTDHLEKAAGQLVEKLLPVLDAMDAAVAHGHEDVVPIQTQLLAVLGKEGLERLDPVGEPFDPNEHDAVLHEEGDGEQEVVEVLRAGYRWKGRVLRAAMVKVKG